MWVDVESTTFAWDIGAIVIALGISFVTFAFAMVIVRADLRRQARELARWRIDVDYLLTHDKPDSKA